MAEKPIEPVQPPTFGRMRYEGSLLSDGLCCIRESVVIAATQSSREESAMRRMNGLKH